MGFQEKCDAIARRVAREAGLRYRRIKVLGPAELVKLALVPAIPEEYQMLLQNGKKRKRVSGNGKARNRRRQRSR